MALLSEYKKAGGQETQNQLEGGKQRWVCFILEKIIFTRVCVSVSVSRWEGTSWCHLFGKVLIHSRKIPGLNPSLLLPQNCLVFPLVSMRHTYATIQVYLHVMRSARSQQRSLVQCSNITTERVLVFRVRPSLCRTAAQDSLSSSRALFHSCTSLPGTGCCKEIISEKR